jgi:signal transduction histidine kinase
MSPEETEMTRNDRKRIEHHLLPAHHLANTVRDLLDEALARSGIPMPITPAPTHMRLVADEALVEAKVDNPDRWIVHRASGDGTAEWDHDRVVQLLSNLLAHALGRSSEATPVFFAWWGEEDEVVIEIEYEPETGGGDREWTLGLSVAQTIAVAHGGDLRTSDSSAGRLFTVALPRTMAARADGVRHAPRRTELEGRTA